MQENNSNDNFGHRKRVKDKILNMSPKKHTLTDVELLEAVLFYSIPRKDVKPIAKQLLKRFGSFSSVLSANTDILKEFSSISENTCTLFKIIKISCLNILQKEVINKPIISSWNQLLDYCYANLSNEKNECLKIIYLNSKNIMIAENIIQEGTINQAIVHPREIVKNCLDLGATSFVLVHNHPSGDPSPSKEDIDMTNMLKKALSSLDINLHDHIIIGKNGIVSFKNIGIL